MSPKTPFALALAIFLATGVAPPVAGQEPGTPGGARPTLSATRVDTPPVIDGRLDDAAWRGVPAADRFIQRQPDPGAPATQRTEARVVYDDHAIYVGVRLYDDRPDLIAAPLARRDAGGISSEWMYVMLDSYHDRRTGFVFAVNPRGVQKDYMIYDDAREDVTWDPVWEVATTIDELGWTAEFRIPLSQLRFDPASETWGLNLQRRVARTEEWSFWSHWPPNVAGYVSHFGTLTGIEELRPARGVEIQPYASARVTRAPGDAGNPFHSPTEAGLAAGADVLVGLTSGLTLSATLNPDFGQVEADPAVVNLTAYETFFTERRPFFVERADVFRFGQIKSNIGIYGSEFFYSRRIGRAPQRVLRGPGFVYVDAPQQSPILGAAKVTGKTGPWTLGMLNAVTGQATARYLDPEGDVVSVPVEPLTNYFASRVRRDLRAGSTVVGSMITATNRAAGSGELDALLGSGAYFGGVDFEHAWGEGVWVLSGYAAGSSVHGDEAAIARLQRLPSRYYDRPDAGHLEYDPSRTSLAGHMGAIALQRGGRFDMTIRYDEASPGFEINDLGFQGRTDYRTLAGILGRRIAEPRGVLRNHAYYAFGANGWNFNGDRHLTLLGGGANGSLLNLWSGGVEGAVQLASVDDRLTRGGPLARSAPEWRLNGSFGTDPRRELSLNVNGQITGNDEGGAGRTLGATADWRPSAAVRLRAGPSVTRTLATRQYVTAATDPGADHTFERRYVFADIDRTTVSLTTRLDWTFTPRLSLELYAQPFLAAGDFSHYKELAAAGSDRFDVYGTDRGTISVHDGVYTVRPDLDAPLFHFQDPAFNIRSLRGNAVLRWEYRPGSTLFLVWQQQRSGFEPLGDFAFRRDAGEILAAPATNVLMIKATYWLGS
jgi:hypothetical protein